jgi:hypothetical protein
MFDYPVCRLKCYTLDEGEEYTDQTLGVDYRNEDWHVFLNVVCPELRVSSKEYSLFTGFEARWEGAPDSSGRIFQRVKIQRKNGLPCGCVEFYISNDKIRNSNIRDDGLTWDLRLCMNIPFKSSQG